MTRRAIMDWPEHGAAAAEATAASLDELVQRGRAQGHLSLAELRATFQTAGIAAAEGRSILRELTEAGVRLADEAAGASAADGAAADAADAGAARPDLGASPGPGPAGDPREPRLDVPHPARADLGGP